jgi:hypothetical protein
MANSTTEDKMKNPMSIRLLITYCRLETRPRWTLSLSNIAISTPIPAAEVTTAAMASICNPP